MYMYMPLNSWPFFKQEKINCTRKEHSNIVNITVLASKRERERERETRLPGYVYTYTGKSVKSGRLLLKCHFYI